MLPFATTFVCCLFLNMEYGILIGAQIHLLLLAYEASRPKTSIGFSKVCSNSSCSYKSHRVDF